MHKHNSLIGIIWIILFCLASTTADGIVRYVTMQGFPSSEMLFIRSFLGILLLLPFVLKNQLIQNVTRKSIRLYIIRGILAFVAISIWFYILKHTDFTALITIGFTAPLFTAFLSIIFLGEKPTFIKIAALIIGFSGTIVVIDPTGMKFNWYLLIGMVSAVFWAVSLIVTKQLSNKENPIAVAFFFALVLMPLSFLLAFPAWQWPTIEQWLFIIIFTAISTCGQIALPKAFSHADLTTLMPFEFIQIIFAAFFAYIVFGDIPMFNTFLGGIIIFGSGYVIVLSERKKRRQEELQIVP